MKKALHQPPPEIREAIAMRPEKRARKRNKHQRWGYSQFTISERDLRNWGHHKKASSNTTSTILPVVAS